MSEQIILKLGCRPMNEAVLDAGFQFAKGTRLPVRAYYMEDESLYQASRFSFSNEVRLGGETRSFEVHELARETKIAMRALNREVQRHSEAAQIEAEFVHLNGDGNRRLQYQVRRPNIMVLGEHKTARQLAKEFHKFRETGQLQGILMAGPKARRKAGGPLVVIVHDMASFHAGFSVLRGYLAAASELVVYYAGNDVGTANEIKHLLADDFDGQLYIEPLKRCDQSRVFWAVERVGPSLLFVMPDAPYIAREVDVEALLRLLSCPVFISLAKKSST